MRTAARLQTAADLLRARVGRRTPLKVTWFTTYRCNVACGFCTRIHLPSGHMDDGQVRGMMDAFARMGTRWWVFNGGEPTLMKGLGGWIAHADALGFDTTMVTNGVRIEQRLDELSRLDLAICSIHGDREEHDRVVQREGSYDAAIAGLRALRDRGVSVCLMAVLNERNLGLLEDLLGLAESLDAGLAVQPVVQTRLAGMSVDPTLVPRAEAIQRGVDDLLEAKMDGRPVSASRAYLEAVAASWPDRAFGVKCWAGRLFCEVTPDGFVVPCCAEEEYTFAGCHGPTAGWEKAFAALPDRSGCQGCWFKGPQELNLLLGLRPAQTARAAANYARGRMLWD